MYISCLVKLFRISLYYPEQICFSVVIGINSYFTGAIDLFPDT